MKKRLLAILCCAVMVFGLCACGGTDSGSKGGNDDVEETETQEEENDEWKEAYKEVIAGVVAEEGVYAFDQEEYGKLEDYAQYLEDEFEYNPGYVYELYDVNEDGIPELFVKFKLADGSFAPIRVFTYENDKVKEFEKEFSEGYAYGVKSSTQYKGILSYSYGRFNGDEYFTFYEIVDGELVVVHDVDYRYTDTQDPRYSESWSWLEWTDVADLSLIENYVDDGIEKESIVTEENE